MTKHNKFVSVYLARGEAEAMIIKGLLDSSGIPCFLKSNAAPSVHVFLADGMGWVSVMVDESVAEEARNLIRDGNRV